MIDREGGGEFENPSFPQKVRKKLPSYGFSSLGLNYEKFTNSKSMERVE
jgi:hypothetical protein